MAGIKNIYQQHGVMPHAHNGKSIWERHEQLMTTEITVYCQKCGNTIEMPSREGPERKSMETYELEMKYRVHMECAQEMGW